MIPTQIKRLARRAAIGIGRGGTPSGNNSGDIFLALSAQRTLRVRSPSRRPSTSPPWATIGSIPLFLAVVEAVDEAVLNAMLAAETMVGHQGHRVEAIDGEVLARIVQAGR